MKDLIMEKLADLLIAGILTAFGMLIAWILDGDATGSLIFWLAALCFIFKTPGREAETYEEG